MGKIPEFETSFERFVMKMSESRTKSLEAFRSFIGGETFTRSDIFSFTENGKNKELGVIRPWFLATDENKISRGLWRFPSTEDTTFVSASVSVPVVESVLTETKSSVVAYHNPTENLVPKKDPLYVPFGHFNDVYSIVKSGKFGEKMDVELINDGPVTLILDTQK